MSVGRAASGGITLLDDRYELLEVVGRGGMADVYRAEDRVLHREVAVKVLRDLTASDADRVRLSAEAETLARLSHPGLVTVLDAGTSGGKPYLVMALIEGSTLADCSGRALDPPRVAEIGWQVAEALAYVHAHGVVHRDVKPGNILLGTDGRAWLGDFGIARMLSDASRNTATGLVIGTASYLSPEQVNGVAVTLASDVYSLGLALLEALTGSPSYPGSGLEAALARLARQPEIPDRLAPAWRSLLAAMTALNPSHRPSAADVAGRLRELSQDPADASDTVPMPEATAQLDASTAADPAPLQTPAPGWRRPARRRSSWIALAALAVVVASLAIAISVLAGTGTENPQRGKIPADTPPRLEQPLRDLHDAVNGSGS